MLNRLKQYDWRNFNYSLVIIVVILCLVSAFTLKLAGGVEKGAGYMRGQLIGMVMGLFIVAFCRSWIIILYVDLSRSILCLVLFWFF